MIVGFDDDLTAVGDVRDDDRIDVPSDTLRPVTAEITDVGGSSGSFARASVGVFGHLGVEAAMPSVTPIPGRTSEMFTQVYILSDENVNTLGTAQHAELYFIIDGGYLALGIALGAVMEMLLTVRAEVYTPANTLSHSNSFQAGFRLEDPSQFGAASVPTELGPDASLLSAGFFTNLFTLEIPLSFQSIDLGIVNPGERIEISYQLDHRARLDTFAEIAPSWGFSDPVQLSGNSQFPTVSFSDPVAFIPAPPALPLFAAGMTLFGLARVGRRA